MILTTHRIGIRLSLIVLALLFIVLALSLVDAQVPQKTNHETMFRQRAIY